MREVGAYSGALVEEVVVIVVEVAREGRVSPQEGC